MSAPRTPRVAIIGAGLSGLTCSRQLSELACDVTVFDKGREPGGRASTRLVELGDVTVGFDHGAQYFTARDPSMRSLVESWIEQGAAAPWTGRIAVLGPNGRVESYSDKPRLVGNPGMSALGRHLARGLDVRSGVHVANVERTDAGWRLASREGEDLGCFSVVVATAPPAQTAALLSLAAPKLAARVASIEMKPCWALMMAFEQPVKVPYDGAFINDGPLSWVARTSSKPGRRHTPDRWVFHAGPDWSSTNVDLDRNEAAAQLRSAAASTMGVRLPDPVYVQAHRWRHAIADTPLEDGLLFDPGIGIGACGDWASGNRVEGAVRSGLHMAHAVAGSAQTSDHVF